jgi:hypothetical protein
LCVIFFVSNNNFERKQKPKMQQPLKRYTKCSSLTILFTVFVITFTLSSSALTTFGKASNTNSNPAAPTQARKEK